MPKLPLRVALPLRPADKRSSRLPTRRARQVSGQRRSVRQCHRASMRAGPGPLEVVATSPARRHAGLIQLGARNAHGLRARQRIVVPALVFQAHPFDRQPPDRGCQPAGSPPTPVRYATCPRYGRRCCRAADNRRGAELIYGASVPEPAARAGRPIPGWLRGPTFD